MDSCNKSQSVSIMQMANIVARSIEAALKHGQTKFRPLKIHRKAYANTISIWITQNSKQDNVLAIRRRRQLPALFIYVVSSQYMIVETRVTSSERMTKEDANILLPPSIIFHLQFVPKPFQASASCIELQGHSPVPECCSLRVQYFWVFCIILEFFFFLYFLQSTYW